VAAWVQRQVVFLEGHLSPQVTPMLFAIADGH
jgi:hypothetical protein